MQCRYHEEHDFELRAHSTPIPHSLAGSGRQDSWDMEGTVGRENGKEGKRKDGKGKGKKRQDSIPVLLFSTSSRDNNN